MDKSFRAHPVGRQPMEGEKRWPLEKPGRDKFLTTPAGSTYEERQAETRELAASPARREMLGSVKAVQDGLAERVDDRIVNKYTERLDVRDDCADFSLLRMTRAMFEHVANPAFTDEQWARIKKSVLGFKYWVDEPGPDRMISWSENHQILFHAGEYLMGQLFPDEVFTNNGMTGREHMAHAEPLIRQWIDRRARWGYSEWDSNIYNDENLVALMALADFALEPEIARLATMAVDLLMFDIASDLYKGMNVTSHGRTYVQANVTGRRDSFLGTTYIGYGLGKPDAWMSGNSMAFSRAYRLPQAIRNVGMNTTREEVESRERHGINLEDAAIYGLDPNSLDDLPFFWGMGAFTNYPLAAPSLSAFHEWNLWNHPFFEEVPPFAKKLPTNRLVNLISKILVLESDRALLSQVNKLTYRTPDYQISSAQDYRPGGIANQHRIWTAALDPDAIVFTSHPGSPKSQGDRTPTYWSGTNRLPRVAQYKNVLIEIYNNKNYTIIGERNFYTFTHAFFPRWAFDEVDTVGNWVFGRAGDGYIALYSSNPPQWTEEGRDAGVELCADGTTNVWICQMGRRAVDGPFGKFKAAVLDAALSVKGLDVSYDAPGAGVLNFGWKGLFTLDGRNIPLRDFKRFDNPYCQADFNTRKFVIESGGSRLTLDFEKITRLVED